MARASRLVGAVGVRDRLQDRGVDAERLGEDEPVGLRVRLRRGVVELGRSRLRLAGEVEELVGLLHARPAGRSFFAVVRRCSLRDDRETRLPPGLARDQALELDASTLVIGGKPHAEDAEAIEPELRLTRREIDAERHAGLQSRLEVRHPQERRRDDEVAAGLVELLRVDGQRIGTHREGLRHQRAQELDVLGTAVGDEHEPLRQQGGLRSPGPGLSLHGRRRDGGQDDERRRDRRCGAVDARLRALVRVERDDRAPHLLGARGPDGRRERGERGGCRGLVFPRPPDGDPVGQGRGLPGRGRDRRVDRDDQDDGARARAHGARIRARERRVLLRQVHRAAGAVGAAQLAPCRPLEALVPAGGPQAAPVPPQVLDLALRQVGLERIDRALVGIDPDEQLLLLGGACGHEPRLEPHREQQDRIVRFQPGDRPARIESRLEQPSDAAELVPGRGHLAPQIGETRLAFRDASAQPVPLPPVIFLPLVEAARELVRLATQRAQALLLGRARSRGRRVRLALAADTQEEIIEVWHEGSGLQVFFGSISAA